MVAARFNRSKHFDFVKLVVVVGIGNAIKARRNLFLVVVDADIESTERKSHTVDGTDIDGKFFYVSLGRELGQRLEPEIGIDHQIDRWPKMRPLLSKHKFTQEPSSFPGTE